VHPEGGQGTQSGRKSGIGVHGLLMFNGRTAVRGQRDCPPEDGGSTPGSQTSGTSSKNLLRGRMLSVGHGETAPQGKQNEEHSATVAKACNRKKET